MYGNRRGLRAFYCAIVVLSSPAREAEKRLGLEERDAVRNKVCKARGKWVKQSRGVSDALGAGSLEGAKSSAAAAPTQAAPQAHHRLPFVHGIVCAQQLPMTAELRTNQRQPASGTGAADGAKPGLPWAVGRHCLQAAL